MGRVLVTLSPTVLGSLAKYLPSTSKFTKIGSSLVGATVGVVTAAYVSNSLLNSSGVTSNLTQLFFLDTQAEILSDDLQARWVDHDVPGKDGEIQQYMGRKSAIIHISGKWIYENKPANSLIEALFGQQTNIFGNYGWNWMTVELFKLLMTTGLPVMLATDFFIGPATVRYEKFVYEGGKPNVYNYQLTFKEYNPSLSLLGTAAMFVYEKLPGERIYYGF